MSLFSLYGLCNPVTYCLVEVSASQSSRKCSMYSVVLLYIFHNLYIHQCVFFLC